MILQIVNYVFGPLFNKNRAYINRSLNYLHRQRKIDRNYLDYIRLSSLELVSSEINNAQLAGAVAELGVYKGKFSRYINQYFSERQLYLFDTFKGFNKKDIELEVDKSFSSGDQDFANTSVKKVLNLMPFPNQCIVKEGYFPETAEGLDENFVFVSIDTDLFEPIYNGLNYFYPRLVKGGYIFVHDYNNDGYKGAKEAVKKFCDENSISFFPLPDSCGTAVIIK